MTYDPDALDRRVPALIARLLPLVEWFNARYLRLRVEGGDQLPDGPTLFVANHNGGIMGPDLFCTLAFLWRRLGPHRPLYALAHDFAMRQLTPLGRLLQQVGAIRATRANAERALAAGGSVLVYPGGDLDAYRHFSRRNEVVLLPRTGFIKVAQAAGVPIVPLVAEGAHRSAIIFTEGQRLARLLRLSRWARLERFPVALALPWIVAPGPWLPYLPLPLPIQLRVLPPIAVPPDAEPDELAREIQARMQRALDEMAR
ncbi:MAG: putative acyltransferase [Myxococcales bacterium]|nr:putative acyltransferase [Myxococcales bacterium]